MSINLKSGQRYKIANVPYKLSIDLSAADHKSILGHTFHGGENQLWIIEKQVNGQWTIRSVEHQKYLGIETSTPKNGTELVGLDRPQFWDIETLPDSKDPTKLWVRGTCFVADYPKGGGAGDNLILWKDWGGKNQAWVLEECESRFGGKWGGSLGFTRFFLVFSWWRVHQVRPTLQDHQ
ncbi:ricin B lectin domain-containing protein [Lactarius indigo]|nr:ricin B lectin domain-containing protein [Lactarius indigo]KAI9437206.1 ricin B lectin domain-containing protein [Lactarius indigo]